MATPNEHANEARALVELSNTEQMGPYDAGYLAAAQIHATLAIAGYLERLADRVSELREDLGPLSKVVASFGSRLD